MVAGLDPESRTPEEARADRDRDKVVRGIAWNWIGTVGGFLMPAFLLVANRLYGPAVFGLYVLALAPIEILQNLVASGYSDAVQRFAARDEDSTEAADVHYAILRRCLVWVASLGAVVFALALLVGRLAVVWVWHKPALQGPILLLSANIPIVATSWVLLGANRAVLDMRPDVLVKKFVVPLTLLLSVLALRLVTRTVWGLCAGLVIANSVGCLLSLRAFARRYDLRRLWSGPRTPVPKSLPGFVLTQGLNMTLVQALWNLDVMMLGGVASSAAIGLYRTAAELARQVFAIRFAFSSVFAPLAARLVQQGRKDELQVYYTRLSRWILSLAAPAIGLLILYRPEVLALANPAYAEGGEFLPLLLLGPLLAAALGLSGNVLVMSGYHWVNLANSVGLVVINVVLNALLIPRWGLTGAATATAVAFSGAQLLQLFEMRYTVGIRCELTRIYKPGLVAALSFAAVFAASDLLGRWAPAPVFAVLYLGGLWALRLDPDDRRELSGILVRLKLARPPADG